MQKKHLVSNVFFISFCLLSTLFLCPEITLNPNTYLFSATPDAIKNYYTFLYQQKYGAGLSFKGMNYPFGENLIYVDAIPLLSTLLGFINSKAIDISYYAVGILNYSVLLSIPLSAFIIKKILTLFNINYHLANISSILIVLNSPQLYRFTGHYALAYLWIIPLAIYLALKSKSIASWAICGTFITAATLIHPYFLALCALPAFFLMIGQSKLTSESLRSQLKHLIALLVPIMIVLFFVVLNDPVNDRSTNPSSLNFQTTLRSLLIPLWSNLKINFHPEGIGFIGLTPLIAILSYFFIPKTEKLPTKIKCLIACACCSTLLSLGVFNFIFEFTTWHNPFRSLGRFSWVSYYLIGVFTVYWLNHLASRFNNRTCQLLFLCLLTLAALDSYLHLRLMKSYLKPLLTENNFNIPDLKTALEKNQIQETDFDAILPLPYYNLSISALSILRSDESVKKSFESSYETGLPIATTFATRGSHTQVLALASIFNDRIKTTALDRKKLLIINAGKIENQKEQDLLNSSKYLATTKQNARLYSTEIEK